MSFFNFYLPLPLKNPYNTPNKMHYFLLLFSTCAMLSGCSEFPHYHLVFMLNLSDFPIFKTATCAIFQSCYRRYSAVFCPAPCGIPQVPSLLPSSCPVGAGIPLFLVLLPAVFRRIFPLLFFRDFLGDSIHRHKPVTLAFVRDIAHFSRYSLLNIRAFQHLFVRLD